jgi:hypothetical protein
MSQTPEERAEQLEELHNQGQEDVAEGKGNNPPHDWLQTNFSAGEERFKEDNEAYSAGRQNAIKQRDK